MESAHKFSKAWRKIGGLVCIIIAFVMDVLYKIDITHVICGPRILLYIRFSSF